MMRLPKELAQRLWQDIENIEGERKVKYITSVDRLAIEQLEIWAERVLDARTIDKVFAKN